MRKTRDADGQPGPVEMATWGVQEAAARDREEASKFSPPQHEAPHSF
jgi:hypothetical protein